MLFARTRTSPTPPPPDLEIQARLHRDRMAGLWAAELLGLIGHAAHDYARDMAQGQGGAHDGDDPIGPYHSDDPIGPYNSDDPIAGRLARDLRGKVGIREIRGKLAHLLHEARRQLRVDRRP